MSDLDSILPSIAVSTFPLIITDQFYRQASLECPKCLALDDFYNRDKSRKFEAVYCKGSLAPTYECQGILGGKHEHDTPCAGVMVEHFHVACQCCGHTFYVALPTEVNHG